MTYGIAEPGDAATCLRWRCDRNTVCGKIGRTVGKAIEMPGSS